MAMARLLIAEKQKTWYDPFMHASDEAQADRRCPGRDAAAYAGLGRMTKKFAPNNFCANSSVTR
jgi:hypothetical protein